MTDIEECKSVYYLQQIWSDLQSNVYKTPWGSVLIHNCDDTGKLLEFKSFKEYKDSGKSLWLNLKLVLFKKDDGTFPVWCCPECSSMQGFTSMGVRNNEADLFPYICIHSRTASFLLPEWDTIWNVGSNWLWHRSGSPSCIIYCVKDFPCDSFVTGVKLPVLF